MGLGNRAADLITGISGSWPFVWAHTAWFACWFVFRLDINMLTLIVSLEAIYLATFVLMSQNRQSERDRALQNLEAQEVDELHGMGKTELRILDGQDRVLERIDALTRALHDHIMQDTREERRDGNGRD